MNQSLYHYSRYIALPLMLFFGFHMLFARVPDKKIFSRFLLSRRLIGTALLILAASYRHLGLYDLSADTQRIFEHNFPNSTAKIGGEKPVRPWYLFWI